MRELLEFDLIEPSDSQWACKALMSTKELSRQEENSAKNDVLAQKEIDFLGMHFVQGEYNLGPHICQELLKLPVANLTTKQIQQFLGVINYVRDFSPNISTYISPLTEMLKKNAPLWGEKKNEEFTKIKEIYKNVKSLYIPSDGKKILQTDFCNEYWNAVLFEEKDGQRKICGYTSGKFKDAEQNYHFTFKEILPVNNGIKKFNFFLIYKEFLIEMDMKTFPKMIQLNAKIIPNPQILRWA
ncbi:putative mitochondrial protein AtMg00860 [Nicotiana tabacum]|uniref:Mitochondrial protein AtMg00860 n=1 Tax=Nicotiana tabacum TaxID=4097 RepID=A0AC58RPE6_TOBAC